MSFLKIIKSIFVLPIMIISTPLVFIILLAIIISIEGWQNIDFKEMMGIFKRAWITSYNDMTE